MGGDGEGCEEVEVLKGMVGVEGDEFGPMVAIGRGGRSGDDAEVLAGIVDADVEETVAVVGVVLLVVDAGGDDAELAGGVAGGEEAVFVGGVTAGFDQEVDAVAGFANAEVEALVRFVEDKGVFGCGRAEGVAEDVVLTLGGLVLGGIEEGARVVGPGDGADALSGVWELDARAEVADVERVLAESGGVGGVGEEVAVGADGHCAERHEGMAFGERVDVEDDLLGLGGVEGGVEVGVGGGAAAVDVVLAALDGAGGVEPIAETVGNGLVGLLDMGEHLGVELALQVGGGRHAGGGVGVLGFKIGDDLGRVLVAHPAVVVVERDAVEGGRRGVAAGDGRLDGGVGGGRLAGHYGVWLLGVCGG